mgnify:CR=1 FL=1
MKNIHKILILTDFSPAATNALVYGTALARAKDAELIVMTVYSLPEVTYDRQAQENYDKAFEQVRRDYFYEQSPNYQFVVRMNEDILEEVALAVNELGADLLVMGAKGKGLSQKIFGSLTHSLMRQAQVPVLAIPEKVRFLEIDQICFACDYAKADKIEPLGVLLSFADAFKAKIRVLNINQDYAHIPFEEAVQVFRIANFFEDFPHSFDFSAEKDVVKAIVKFVKEENVGLVALMPQKRNFFDRLFKSSVTEEVLHQINVPLLSFHQ